MSASPAPPSEAARLLALLPAGLGPVAPDAASPELAAALSRREPGLPMPPLGQAAPGSLGAAVLGAAPATAEDPVALLRGAAAKLAPGGVLLASLPNAEHAPRLRALLAGTAHPDRHRAFPRAAVLRLVEAAGLVPLDLLGEAPGPEAAAALADAVSAALPGLGTTRSEFLRRAAPARWLLRAGTARPEPLVIVAHVLKPVGGVNEVRIGLPLAALASHPGVAVRIGEKPELPELPPGTPRILLLQRRLLDSPAAPAFVQGFRARGWLVVQEFDDDPDHWPVIRASGHFAFRGVHAVQTSTPALAALFAAFNEEVAVFPNTVAELPEPANFADRAPDGPAADPRRLTLFLGALRREADTAPFLPALNRVLAEAGDRLAVEVLFDRAAFDALATPHKRFQGILPYADYRALMGRCEIAFLPLADTRFNGFKSDLKFVEAGAHRMAAICSPVVYGGTVRDGETGLLAATPEAVEAALRGLLATPDRARALGEAARGWVARERMLAGQVPARLAWYRGLWARRAELDAALLRRAPEMRGFG